MSSHPSEQPDPSFQSQENGSQQDSVQPYAEGPAESAPPPQEEQKQLPAWLRAELGKSSPNVGSTSYTGPESYIEAPTPQSEVERLRAELAQARSESVRYRQQLMYQQEQRTYARPRERGGCLTAWLIFQSIGVALTGAGACLLASQGAPPLLAVFYTAFAVLLAISIYGVWNLFRWGYYMQLMLYLLGLGVYAVSICVASSNGYSVGATSFSGIAGSIIGLIILNVLVRDRWEMFE